MAYQKIRNILEDTNHRIEKLHVPYENEFRMQIKYLHVKEKAILRQFIFEQEWNLGSSKVLSMLQEAGIVTASEYVLRLRSSSAIQQVMNDLLEVEHILLADIISNAHLDTSYSTTLREVLHDSFNSVLDDLIAEPNVVPCNYLERLKSHLPDPDLTRLRTQHLQLLLGKEKLHALSEAVGLQEQWRAECEDRRSTTLGRIMLEVVQDQANAIETLFASAKTKSLSWKYYLALLHMVAVAIEGDKVEIVRVKGILKDLFNRVVDAGDFETFMILMVSAREICMSNERVLGSYSGWYKATIGEMSYRIKKEQFAHVVELMTRLIGLEKDPEVLKVHINISVSTPPKCMELIVNYKQLCRAHLAKLLNERTRDNVSMDCETSIVIDDD
ncbi:AAEL009440-PA [Aedes aegypti]|uniref:AAEL009440-PA n=1 Tax=Aedes aegypti TaxID=7159 RepID=Q16VS9_AEDAE|nr:AAEL009440-PA [Aedes aegypti]